MVTMNSQEYFKKELTSLLEGGFKTKSDTAYFLVLCRKILELTQNKDDNFISLYFYANWCLHAKIDRRNLVFKSLTKSISGEVNKINLSRRERGRPELLVADEEEMWAQDISEIVSTTRLFQDLDKLNKELDIDFSFSSNRDVRNCFRKQFIDLVANVPVEIVNVPACPVVKFLLSHAADSLKVAGKRNDGTPIETTADFLLEFADGKKWSVLYVDST